MDIFTFTSATANNLQECKFATWMGPAKIRKSNEFDSRDVAGFDPPCILVVCLKALRNRRAVSVNL